MDELTQIKEMVETFYIIHRIAGDNSPAHKFNSAA